MTLPASSNTPAIEFTRQLLLNRLSLPSPAFAIYPQNSENTALAIQVTTTSVTIYFVSLGLQSITINYVGRSIDAVVSEINSNRLPLKAVALNNEFRLQTGDLILGSPASYQLIPSECPIYSRIPNKGIIVRTTKYNVKHKSLAQLRALDPYPTSVHLPWYPRISNGSFTYKEQGKTYHFGIPEFDEQTWSIRYGKPFRDVIGANMVSVGTDAYKVPRAPIYWTGENIKLYNDRVILSSTVIVDVDTNNGIIYVKPGSVINEQTQVDYSYLETSYEYKHVNINAHITQNPQLIDKFVLLYAVPVDSSVSVTNKRTIFHSIADSMEEAQANIRLEDPTVPVAIIGGYSIRQVLATDRIHILDTRVKGGGLIANTGPVSPVHLHDSPIEPNPKEKPIEEMYQNAVNFWDVGNWDGEVYPGAAAILMDIPNELRKVLSDNELRSRASKFVAAGVYPVYSFTDRPLPAISGRSTQIATVFNEDLSAGGAGIMSDNITLPGSTLTGEWPAFDIEIPVSNSILSVGAETGYYIPYLRSSPTVGIEWKERDSQLISGALDDTVVYSPWVTKRVYDSKDVTANQLVKGHLRFPRSPAAKDYKDITIHAPYRIDRTGDFKSDLASTLYEMKTAIDGRMDTTAVAVAYDYTDITDSSLLGLTDRYFGLHEGLRFLQQLKDTDLAASYSGSLDVLSQTLTGSLSSTFPHITFYDPSNQVYYSLGTDSSGIDPREAVISYSKALEWDKQNGRSYVAQISKLVSLMSGLVSVKSNGYIGSSFDYNGSFSPQIQILPEQLGYSYAEVGSYNSDTNLNHLLPSISSVVPLLTYLDQPDTETYGDEWSYSTYVAAPALDCFMSGIGRFERSLLDDRTIDGIPVVTNWYVPYNRYGKFAGKWAKDLTQTIDDLYRANMALATTLSSYKGIDGSAITTYYSGLNYILDTAFDGVNALVTKGGTIEPEVTDLLYSYGWMAKNRDLLTTLSGKVGSQSMVIDVPPTYSGLFHTGLYTLVKGMTTPDGEIFETTLINNEPGPFDITPPGRIFDALKIAIDLDRGYLPLAQAVVNTVTGHYMVDGKFYQDALRVSASPGAEDRISYYMARLYGSL